ncbi:MAG: helix-turn-helix domain-containing protein [Promethearchaeota archaeon]
MSDPVVGRILVTFPEKIWIHAICQKFPGLSIEIESFLPGNSVTHVSEKSLVGNALIKISGTNIELATEEIKAHPSVVEMHVMSKGDTNALVNVKTRDRWLLGSLIKSESVLRFPVSISWDAEGKRAVGIWITTGLRNRVDHLLDLLEERGVQFEILGLEGISNNKIPGTLTPRQAEILDIALESGFFEIPRKITLTELAGKIGIAKSTLSGILRRISQKRMNV